MRLLLQIVFGLMLLGVAGSLAIHLASWVAPERALAAQGPWLGYTFLLLLPGWWALTRVPAPASAACAPRRPWRERSPREIAGMLAPLVFLLYWGVLFYLMVTAHSGLESRVAWLRVYSSLFCYTGGAQVLTVGRRLLTAPPLDAA